MFSQKIDSTAYDICKDPPPDGEVKIDLWTLKEVSENSYSPRKLAYFHIKSEIFYS